MGTHAITNAAIGDYMRLNFIADLITPGGVATPANDLALATNACDTGVVKRTFLLRVAPIAPVNPGAAKSQQNLNGSCVNYYGNAAAAPGPIQAFETQSSAGAGTAADSSFFFVKFATNKVKIGTCPENAAENINCKSNCTVIDSGFVFTAGNGESDCGGKVSVDNDAGLVLGPSAGATVYTGNAVRPIGYNVKAYYYVGKKHLAFNLAGPFNEATCGTEAADRGNSFPIVLPLEDAGTTAPAKELALGTTGVCYNYGADKAANSAVNIQAKVTSTLGQLDLILSRGTGAAWTDNTTCAHGPDPTYWRVKVSMGLRGNFDGAGSATYPCVQAINTTAATMSAWFEIRLARESIGTWVSEVAQTVCAAAGAAAAPAPGLHVSAALAMALAVIAMVM